MFNIPRARQFASRHACMTISARVRVGPWSWASVMRGQQHSLKPGSNHQLLADGHHHRSLSNVYYYSTSWKFQAPVLTFTSGYSIDKHVGVVRCFSSSGDTSNDDGNAPHHEREEKYADNGFADLYPKQQVGDHGENINADTTNTSDDSSLPSTLSSLGLMDLSSSYLDMVNATTIAISTTALAATYGIYQYLTYDYRWWWKKRANQLGLEVFHQPNWETELIHGHVEPGWERVRDEFVQNFRARGELGAAVCVYHRGKKVVDLWGGFSDRETKTAWEKDTMVPVFSTTKGISAMALYMLASRGLIDFKEKVVTYWPEFGANGKENVTVEELIDHSVGLAGISPPVTLEMLQRKDDNKSLRDHLAAADMEWSTPGEKKGYMATTLGFYESALVQLADREGRTIGRYLRDEAFEPLEISDEIFIGLPEDVPSSRVARLDVTEGLEGVWPTGTLPDGFLRRLMFEPSSYTGRAFRNPKISSPPSFIEFNRREVQAVEMPASCGIATARAIATMYRAVERVIKNDGVEADNPLGLTQDALVHLTEPAKPGQTNGWVDEVLGFECCMGGGFMVPLPPELRGTSAAVTKDGGGRFWCAPGGGFGTPGAGGSFGFCDPEAEIAFAFVPNRGGGCIADDPREYALRNKVYEAVNKVNQTEQGGPTEEKPGLQISPPHYLTKRYIEAHPELALLP